jgi:hypothetical protein
MQNKEKLFIVLILGIIILTLIQLFSSVMVARDILEAEQKMIETNLDLSNLIELNG